MQQAGVRAVVITGNGPVFCAGMDLKAYQRGELPILTGRGFGGLTRATIRKPLIAAVEGWAVGGGFELALACDLIVAANDAKFGFPEVTRGLVASEGGLIRLPHHLPYHVAMGLFLTGAPLEAAVANQYGLVSQLTASGQALTVAQALAVKVAANAPLALDAVKAVVRGVQGLNDDAAFLRQDELIASVTSSEDAREGALAFAQKRPPVWKGR